MKIGILGTGHIGATVAKRLGSAGHDVKVANSRGPHTIPADVLSTGARAVNADDAVSDVEVLVLSIPLHQVPAVAALVRSTPPDTVVIDTSNYYPARDTAIAALDEGQVESVWVAQQLGRPVVKAWNSIDSDSFARLDVRATGEDRIAVPVAADDDEQRRLGMRLVEETGLAAVDAGPLAGSWRQQPGTPCYCTNLRADEIPSALATADATRSPRRRDMVLAIVLERHGDIAEENAGQDFLVRLNRLVYR